MSLRTTTLLQEEVEAKLQQDWLLKDFPIDVFDDNGVMILTGKVPSKTVSVMIEALVREVDGVVGVSNGIFIQPRQ